VGFGSVTVPGHQKLLQNIMEAIQLAKCRALICTTTDPGTAFHPETMLCVRTAVPHSWLFSRMALIIHHGGAGTVAYALKAGVPSIVMPFFGDHHLWASRLHNIRCGPPPVSPTNVTPQGLAQAITNTINDTEIRNQLLLLRSRIAAEDGVGKAVQSLEYIQKTGQLPPQNPSTSSSPLQPFISPSAATTTIYTSLHCKFYELALFSVNLLYQLKITGIKNSAIKLLIPRCYWQQMITNVTNDQ
jgi:hypothetical protein